MIFTEAFNAMINPHSMDISFNFITYKEKRMNHLVFSGKDLYPLLQLVRENQANGMNAGGNVAMNRQANAMWEDGE
jgi:hypothetical protein